MKLTPDPSVGAWLGERLGTGGLVTDVVPSGFDAYVRVFHPVTATRHDPRNGWDSEPETRPAGWAMLAAAHGVHAHALMTWSEIAGDEPGQVELGGGWLVTPPTEGMLDPDALAALARVLVPHTTPGTAVRAAVWSGYGELNSPGDGGFVVGGMSGRDRRLVLARLRAEHEASVSLELRAAIDTGRLLRLPSNQYAVLDTSLDELADPGWTTGSGLGWSGSSQGRGPNLLWADDRSWVLASDIDLDSTIVGGSAELVAAILADNTLEAAPVRADDTLPAA